MLELHPYFDENGDLLVTLRYAQTEAEPVLYGVSAVGSMQPLILMENCRRTPS
jgi:hypothetical protein